MLQWTQSQVDGITHEINRLKPEINQHQGSTDGQAHNEFDQSGYALLKEGWGAVLQDLI
jgi:hypothetical protein